jgi:hypothetical protein
MCFCSMSRLCHGFTSESGYPPLPPMAHGPWPSVAIPLCLRALLVPVEVGRLVEFPPFFEILDAQICKARVIFQVPPGNPWWDPRATGQNPWDPWPWNFLIQGSDKNPNSTRKTREFFGEILDDPGSVHIRPLRFSRSTLQRGSHAAQNTCRRKLRSASVSGSLAW